MSALPNDAEDSPEATAERLARIAHMSDAELRRRGRAAEYMAGSSDRPIWKTKLEEYRAEWRRRHPRKGRHPRKEG